MELHRTKEAVEAYEKAIQSKIPPSADVGDEQSMNMIMKSNNVI